MFTFPCSACQTKLSVKETLTGKKVKCPVCGQVTTVPDKVAVVPPGIEELGTLPPAPVLAGQGPGTEIPAPVADGTPPTHPSSSQLEATHGADARDADRDSSLTDFLSPPQAKDELGRLGKYRILKVLGHGGMGVVYQAEDPLLERRVAIKAMLPALAASASAGKRFLREARAMAAVDSDHIVRIYQVDEDRGIPFLAMEFLKGEPLDQRLRREPRLPTAEVLRIGREIARALQDAHHTGLIHRDIKPANIWLEDRHSSLAPGARGVGGEGPRVKLLDFGLARAAAQDSGLTQQGMIVGTPAFMAPEQGRGETVDSRCDLFSLGVVLYRLCTGRLPFQGNDTVSTLLAVAMNEPLPPSQLNADVPSELSDLVMKLLEKDPAQRLASAGEVVAALQILEKQWALRQEVPTQQLPRAETPMPQAATPPPRAQDESAGLTTQGVTAPRRGRRPALVLAAVLLLLGGAFGVWALTRFERTPTVASVKLPPDKDHEKKEGGKKPEPVLPKEKPAPPLVGQAKATLTGNPGQVHAVAFSPDGKTLASGVGGRQGSLFGKIQLWDVASGQVKTTLKADGVTVNSVAFSPDGKTLASGAGGRGPNQPGEIQLWDVASGQVKAIFKGEARTSSSVAFSPDGKTLASGVGGRQANQPGEIQLWDVASGQMKTTLKAEARMIQSLAFSPDGKTLASGVVGMRQRSQSNEIQLWDVVSGQVKATLTGEAKVIHSVAFSPDGKVLASSGSGQTIKLWDVASGQEKATLTGHTAQVNAVAFSLDGKTLASASGDKTIKLWDVASGQAKATLTGHTAPVSSVAFSGDGKTLASGSFDSTIKLWDVASLSEESEAGFVSLFNGKDLTGWVYPGQKGASVDGKTETPDGRIAVEGGAIVMREKDANGRGGIKDLYTKNKFDKDFILKLEFRAAPRADSGVYIRGPQLQVRDYPTVGPYKKLKNFKDGGWNELEIVVKGAVAECLCNGEVLESAFKIPVSGAIGLQAETGKFEFRRLRIKEIGEDNPQKESAVVPPRTGRSETIKLFNGENLDGWEGNTELWAVKDGVIVGKNTAAVQVSTYLLTRRSFSDFRLLAKGKLVQSEMHSGIALWGRTAPEKGDKWTCAGHLVMFPSGWGMYDLYGRNSLPVDGGPAKKVGKQHDWNDLEILAQGNRIRVAVNGVAVVDWRDPLPERIKEGPIGLQLHSNNVPQEVHFKDLTITTFPPEDKLLTVK